MRELAPKVTFNVGRFVTASASRAVLMAQSRQIERFGLAHRPLSSMLPAANSRIRCSAMEGKPKLLGA
jgi:hypothetical protein